MASSCAVTENEKIIRLLRSLESQYARTNPSSKFRFTIKRAMASVAKHTEPIRSGKEARKLEGIGEMLGAKIDQLLGVDDNDSASATEEAKGEGRAATARAGKGRQKQAVSRKKAAPEVPALSQSSQRHPTEADEHGLDLDVDAPAFSQGARTADLPPEGPSHRTAVGRPALSGTLSQYETPRKARRPPSPTEIVSLLSSEKKPEAAMPISPAPATPLACEKRRLGGAAVAGGGASRAVVEIPSTEKKGCESEPMLVSPAPNVGGGGKRKDPVTPLPAGGPSLAYYTELLRGRKRGGRGRIDLSEDAEDWHAVLLVDVRERGNEQVQTFLLEAGVVCEIRQLALGDMVWIARRKRAGAPLLFGKRQPPVVEELMLRYVIERKTSRDLAASIIDGRYKEQKHRLHSSPQDRILYLVEGSLGHQDAMGTQSLRTAMGSSQVVEGLRVVTTDSLDQTVSFLRRMHDRISASLQHFLREVDSALREPAADTQPPSWEHSDRCPFAAHVMPYSEYQEAFRKCALVLPVRSLFGRQLRQIQGVSVPIAEAILTAYPTPFRLLQALAHLDEKQGSALLQSLPVKGRERGIGPSLARLIYHVFKAQG